MSQELFERNDELAHIEAQLALAREGQGGLVLITGPAGIGKTALCDAAAARAHEAGMRVLSARGGELETGFSFGVVRQLVEPLLATATGAERRKLLAGAAERALVALEGEDDGHAPTPFGVIHGLYWLMVNAATATPMAVVIDDVQWIDRASLRWLLYVAERLESLRIVLVLAFRPGESEDADLLARLEQIAGQRVVVPPPLTAAGTRALLESIFGTSCSEHFVAQSHTMTGGNPFLLAELALALRADGAAPDDAAAERLLEVAPGAVARAVGMRVARQGSDAVELARALAILGDGAPLHQVAALAGLEVEAAGACADRLAAIGVLEPAVPLRFVHAIMRSAVYEDMPAVERSVRHRAAARKLASLGTEPEHVCAQLLRTEPAASAEAVDQLRAGARQLQGPRRQYGQPSRRLPGHTMSYVLRTLAAVLTLLVMSGASLTAAAAASAPSISVKTPVNGASYNLNSTVNADYACSDPDGDVASCTGTVARGKPIDTSDVASYTFKVTATDKAGNSSSKTVKYYVIIVVPGGAPPPRPPSPTLGATGPTSTEDDGSSVTFDTGNSVSCPDKGKSCTSDVTVKSKGKKIAGKRFKIPAGKRVKIRLKLNKDGARRLRKAGKLRVKLIVKSRWGKAPTVTDTQNTTQVWHSIT